MSENFDIKVITKENLKKIKDFKINYGFAKTPFGDVCVGISDDEKRVCFMGFYSDKKEGLAELKKVFPTACLEENNSEMEPIAKNMFKDEKEAPKILLKGTEFETNVWKELINLKKGSTYSYEEVAKSLGNPKAIRAVSRAIAKNNISYLVPCHRVISKSGGMNKYKWGSERKIELLKKEDAL